MRFAAEFARSNSHIVSILLLLLYYTSLRVLFSFLPSYYSMLSVACLAGNGTSCLGVLVKPQESLANLQTPRVTDVGRLALSQPAMFAVACGYGG